MLAPRVQLVARETEPEWTPSRIRLPEDAFRLLGSRFDTADREYFGIIALDTRNQVIDVDTVSVGTLNGSIVHPREVFKTAILVNAAAIVLWHNHPSGDPSPSREDRELTTRLANAGRILGIQVLDHIIVGAGRYWSFQEKGDL